jgi:hypothetical protein
MPGNLQRVERHCFTSTFCRRLNCALQLAQRQLQRVQFEAPQVPALCEMRGERRRRVCGERHAVREADFDVRQARGGGAAPLKEAENLVGVGRAVVVAHVHVQLAQARESEAQYVAEIFLTATAVLVVTLAPVPIGVSVASVASVVSVVSVVVNVVFHVVGATH